MVSSARTELQSKYHQAFSIQQRAVSTASADNNEASAGITVQKRANSPVSADVQENTSLDKHEDQSAVETMETATSAGVSLNSHTTEQGELVETLERVKLSESSQSKSTLNSKEMDNYFLRKQMPKSHYVAILEKSDASSISRKQKFKPNQ